MATDEALGSSLSKTEAERRYELDRFFFLSLRHSSKPLCLPHSLSFLSGLVKSLSVSTETELSNTSRGEKKKSIPVQTNG